MTEKEIKMNNWFMDVAKRTAENSYATRAKVGAVLVKDGRIIATGWNGQPTGLDNNCEYFDNELKKLVTKSTVIHAEANIITFCAKYGIETNGTDLYLTLSPCINCALLILQAGIKRVFFHDVYRNIEGINFLKNVGIEVVEM